MFPLFGKYSMENTHYIFPLAGHYFPAWAIGFPVWILAFFGLSVIKAKTVCEDQTVHTDVIVLLSPT